MIKLIFTLLITRLVLFAVLLYTLIGIHVYYTKKIIKQKLQNNRLENGKL